jgi:hypothetical protein
MGNKLLASLIVVGLSGVVGEAANAAGGSCAKFDKILTSMALRFSEVPVAGDVHAAPHVLLFMSPAATWTIFTVNAEGVACAQASGTRWESFKPNLQELHYEVHREGRRYALSNR